MNRTLRYKALYGLILLVGVAAGIWAAWSFAHPLVGGAVLALLLLTPGRVQGYAWRSFFTGRRAQAEGRYSEAMGPYLMFLNQIRERPGLKRLIWLSWGMYSRDIEAMTESNLGACLMELGDLSGAEARFKRALTLDGSNPIPHYNLAIVSEYRKDRVAAEEHAATARRLGYSSSSVDRVIHRVGELLAKVEGR